jgi:hypothetical protein
VFFDLLIDFPPVAIPLMQRIRVLWITEPDRINEVFKGKRTKADFALNTLTQIRLVGRDSVPNVPIQ